MKRLLTVAVATLTGLAVMASPSHAEENVWTGRVTADLSVHLTPGTVYTYTFKWSFPDRKGEIDEVGVCAGNTGAEPLCVYYDPATDPGTKRNRRGWSTWISVQFPADYCNEWYAGEYLDVGAAAFDLDRKKFQDRAFMSLSVPVYCE